MWQRAPSRTSPVWPALEAGGHLPALREGAQLDTASDFPACPVRDPSQSGWRPISHLVEGQLSLVPRMPSGGQGLPGRGRHLRQGARTCRPLGWEVRAGSGPRGGSGGQPGLCGPCSHPLRLPKPPRVRLGICWGGHLCEALISVLITACAFEVRIQSGGHRAVGGASPRGISAQRGLSRTPDARWRACSVDSPQL